VNDNATLGTGGLTLGNSGGFTAAASKVLTANNTLTLAGTDATTHTFPTTSATIARTDAAQTFTGDQTLSANLVQGTAAKGFNFTANTPAAGMTSQLFKWYEEGAWTPTQGGGLTVVGSFSSSGTYTRVGRLVTVQGYVKGSTSVAINAAGVLCGNLPFTVVGTAYQPGTTSNEGVTAGGICMAFGASTDVYSCTTLAATLQIFFNITYTA
jgi:hypothetical protein